MNRAIATLCYIGLLRPGPGTWGSLAAVPMAWILHGLGGFLLLAFATVLAFFLGWWATAQVTRGQTDHDPSEIVIDELVGQWIALWPLSAGLWAMGSDPWMFPWPGWAGAFLFFRAFDIWKPWPVSWADRQETPLGVMLDDVIAGLMAALVVSVSAAMAHGI
ncbi:phosphatidylglycerophosphatase A [Actibacterium sp. 188UL27-1]|uniref:phosphatidylglycerophosphatase A family protein n=1 Tax=Actibacterium sp. 188UL27-1 TaxID=2786961 RepID=UPI00195699F4|nr:phosphatidylglycerophosphatase A [Actibacterium sp. 188UL27-1]MBM7067833.1 phosphatidylglycerophosphatase A [Actibacterium sp. 188UL27-1]